MRPDFRCEELKLIIEFDGDSHYCKAERILKDKQKDDDYINLGYKIFRIPYFIQMSTKLLKIIFDEDIKFTQIYPNGFIDKKATLPADFCELGIELFIQDLEKFDYCKDEIIESLKKKIEEKENMNFVVPSSLFYLLRNNKKVYKYLHENRIDDILISNIRPYLKKIWFADFEGGCSNDVLCIKSLNQKHSYFIYYTLEQDSFFNYVMAGSKGTKMPRGDKQWIMDFKIAIPDIITLNKFSEFSEKSMNFRKVAEYENQKLEELKELLLAKMTKVEN